MSLEEQIAQTVDPTVFVRLCNAVLTAEYPLAYQVIDGSTGDDGNDGWLASENRIFAIYCPVKPERRTGAEYKRKALDDLAKAFELRESGQYPVKRWTFITPRKLTNEVVAEIRAAGDEFGIEVNHVEATYLSGLLLKHKHLLKDFPDYYVSQLDELIKRAVESPEAKNPKPSRVPEYDIFSFHAAKKAAAKDESLRAVLELRESADPVEAKRELRALYYRSTDPLAQINAVAGLVDFFNPIKDDSADLASLCEAARGAARRIDSKSAEAYFLSQRGYYQSFEFGRLLVERYVNMMTEQALGMSIENPRHVAERQRRLEQLSKGFTEAFSGALELARESQSGPAMAAVLISIGNAAGQRAMTLRRTGPRQAYEHERDACKRALLGAKDIYAQIGSEHEVANALMNLANQIRFLGEVEEAKGLVKSVIPIAEKYDDKNLLRKARLLEERLVTGKIPDYMAGEESGL